MPLILPSLLDRLIDDVPTNEWDVIGMLKDKVKRDLEILMNSRALTSFGKCALTSLSDRTLQRMKPSELTCISTPLEDDYPEVATSVVNYGIQDYTGLLRNEFNIREVVKMIENAILTFEPRIVPSTLEILPDCERDAADKLFDDLPIELKNNFFEKGAFEFIIKGAICATPIPIDFRYTTEMSLSTGKIKIT